MARRAKLDVRWDVGFLARAAGIAEGLGVRTSVVVRRAAELGLAGVAESLRADVTAGGVPSAGLSAEQGMVRGAARAPAAVGVAGVPPRPPAAPTSSSSRAVKLEAVVAGMLAGLERRPVPVDSMRARAKVKAGKVRVGGVVVKDPGRLVDPVEVGLDG